MEIAGTSFCCPGFLESWTHKPSRRTRASRGGSLIGLDKKNRTIAELTGIRIAPRIKTVNPSRFKRIPGCFDKPLAPVGWRWVKNRPARLLGRLVDDGLLSSVVNGCQRSGGFGREDWDHKGKRQKAGKAESRESRKPGNTESQRAQRREGRKSGKHKARKHRVTENTERKIAMVGACLGDGQSCKDLQWTVLDATVSRSLQANKTEEIHRKPRFFDVQSVYLSIRSQSVSKPFTATELCVQNLPRTTC